MSAVFERGVFRSLKTGARIEYNVDNLNEDNGFGGNFRNPILLDRSVKLLMNAPYNFKPFFSLDRNGLSVAPVSNDVFGNNECPFSNLVLTNMTPKIAASNNIVDVEMSYDHVLDGYNQILRNPPSGRLFVKARTNIVEKTTNFYRKEGNLAAPKDQIYVAHTFPMSDTDVTAMPFYDPVELPRTVVQTGEVTVPFPAKGFTLQGMIFTNNIVDVAEELVARVNTDDLLKPTGGASTILHWVCSEFAWEMHCGFPTAWFPGGPAYKVSIEFQYNYDTWDVDVLFNDKRTGQPPANLVEGTVDDGRGVLRLTPNVYTGVFQPAGRWRVPYLRRQNFQGFFGARFEAVGFVPPVVP